MHKGDACGAKGMGFHAGRGIERAYLHTEFGRGAVEVRTVDVSNNEGAAPEFLPRTFEGLFHRFDSSIRKLIAQCR